MSFRRLKAVARKEALHILRDSRSLAMALMVPIVMLLLFGYALTLDVDRIPTLVYDADHSPQSRELTERFHGSRFFEIVGYVSEYRTIEEKVNSSECLLGVVIPRDYSSKLLSNQEAEVQLLLDGSDSNTASIALGYAEVLLQTYALEIRSRAQSRKLGKTFSAPIEPRLRVWYNSELKSKNYIVPGLIAVVLMIIAALLTSLTIAREWDMGTMEQLLSTPLRPAELVLGKMSAYFVVGVVDMLLAILVGVFLFEVPMRGSILLLLVSSFIFLAGALFWGIMISAIARTQLLAYQMGMVSSFLPAFLLSGFIYSIDNMPRVIQIITRIVPARYFITIAKGIFLKGVGIQILWMELLFLLVYAGVVFLVATRKVGQKLA